MPLREAMTTPPVLDEAHAAFIQRGVAIAAASRDAGNIASVGHACGCRVSADRRRVTLFVAARASRALLDDVRTTGMIAAVFCEPSTNRTIQLKGLDAAVASLTAADTGVLPAYVESMVEQMALCGFSEAYARAAWGTSPEDLVAVTFTPTAAFVQTPGPRAGAPLQR